MKVYAPGKLILSGEHAVVHGYPAIAMAVNRFAVASITSDAKHNVAFDLTNLSHRSQLSFDDLLQVKNRIKRKFQKFKRGEYQIRDVLRKPFELVQAALGIVAGSKDITLPDGMRVHVTSDIPIGSGMGSSAASILCVMKAASEHLNIPISTDLLYKMALEAENLQHGNSSGLDLRVALHGGCVYVHGAKIEARDVPQFNLYLIDTGCPDSSTGECVKQVAAHFTDTAIGDQFALVTNKMDRALGDHSWQGLHDAIQENHRLLCEIGVVPEIVTTFIREVEQLNAAAKVCGAGAISGDKAGIVMVLTKDEVPLKILCNRYKYQLMSVQGETRGVHVA